MKTSLTKQDAQNALTEMQMSAAEFERQAGSLSAGGFFHLQGTDREYTESCDFDFGERRTGDFYGDTRSEEENSPVRVDLDCGSDLVHGAVRLGRAVEQMTDDAPQHDGTTMLPHIDSKRRKKLRQKKTALDHAEDDHEEMRMDTM